MNYKNLGKNNHRSQNHIHVQYCINIAWGNKRYGWWNNYLTFEDVQQKEEEEEQILNSIFEGCLPTYLIITTIVSFS